MAKHGKKYRAGAAKIEPEKLYPLDEAVKLRRFVCVLDHDAVGEHHAGVLELAVSGLVGRSPVAVLGAVDLDNPDPPSWVTTKSGQKVRSAARKPAPGRIPMVASGGRLC